MVRQVEIMMLASLEMRLPVGGQRRIGTIAKSGQELREASRPMSLYTSGSKGEHEGEGRSRIRIPGIPSSPAAIDPALSGFPSEFLVSVQRPTDFGCSMHVYEPRNGRRCRERVYRSQRPQRRAGCCPTPDLET